MEQESTENRLTAERNELEAVLNSGLFDVNSNIGKLLRHLCEKHFQGADEEIKEYSLAVDVFGRKTGFDNRRNSIVRVEASRLRKRLDEYYAGEGKDHPLRIVIPPGRYVPQFVLQGAVVPDTSEAANSSPAGPFRIARLGVWLIVFLCVAAGGLFLWLRRPPDPMAPGETPGKRDAAAQASGEPLSEVRILAGYNHDRYVDRAGNVWLGDRYFQGGTAVPLPPGFIARTLDPTIFLNMRTGPEFSYDIPLRAGNYELRLHFAEQLFGPTLVGGGGETSRLMILWVNGQRTLYSFDVYANAGGDRIADARVFRNIGPAPDGFLHLRFSANWDRPFVNAIEVLPAPDGRARPIRLAARETSYTDRAGQVWLPDNYFSGGRLARRTAVVTATGDPELYGQERYGRFNYAIPVAPGRYRLTLHFAETWHTQRLGLRVFHVLCNGEALLRSFDIAREAGGPGRALQKTFRAVQPGPDGKIRIEFVPVVNYGCLNAIEVVED